MKAMNENLAMNYVPHKTPPFGEVTVVRKT